MKFEASDGKIWWEIGGEDFLPGKRSTRNFGVYFSASFGQVFGNFVSNFASFNRELRSAEGR